MALSVCLPAVICAQPSIKDTPALRKGTLPNNVSYYLLPNSSEKGYATYALLQKNRQCVSEAREALVSLPHFGKRSPQAFLRDNKIVCGAEGFISYDNGNTLYSFRNAASGNSTLCDSMLLMLFDLASYYEKEQAIIICGDINADNIAGKLGTLSLILNKRQADKEEAQYEWQTSALSYAFIPDNNGTAIRKFSLQYCLPRLERDKMSSFQAIVSRQYATYFGKILSRRIIRDFRYNNIALADIQVGYSDSSCGPGDEEISLEISTSESFYKTAVSRIAAILAELDSIGASLEELQDAKEELIFSSLRSPAPDNDALLQACCASFLYGAPVNPSYNISKFFANNRLSSDKELVFFNKYCSALLDKEDNLSLGFDSRFRDERMPLVFAEGWKADSGAAEKSIFRADSLNLYKPAARVKLRSNGKDRTSGGELWTFSNGMRVVYKKSAQRAGAFAYAMMIRGGGSAIEGLGEGECAFVADMLTISDICGMNGIEFRDLLRTNGITMDSRVSASDLTIRGSAPSERLGLLLKALLSVANCRSIDKEAFEYYRQTEPLRISAQHSDDRNYLLDSLLSPKWRYPEWKRQIKLRESLPLVSEEYFKKQFANCSDGILVLIGDLDAEALKKELSSTLGDFKTGRKTISLPQIKRKAINGTVNVSGNALDGANFAMSRAFDFKMSEYILCRLARTAMEYALAPELSSIGARLNTNGRLELYPEARYTIYLNASACPRYGLPQGADSPQADEIARKMNSVLDSLASGKYPLETIKTLLKNEIQAELQDNETLAEAVALRYMSGKDIASDYAGAISSISEDALRKRIKEYISGGRVNYIAK